MLTRQARVSHRVIFVIAALSALGWGCTKIDYVGKSYPPTTNVEMFFAEEDVTREYEVMGHMVANADDIVSAEKMQKKIMEKAQEKGADAVIIFGLERYQSGETTNYNEESKDEKNKTKTSGSSSTSAEYKKEIRATLIKWK